MSQNSKIEWTHHTFNPWWGCTKVGPGCDHCYAERDAHRFGTGWGADAERRTFSDKHWNEPRKWNRLAAAAGTRHRVFCASMADVFDKDAPAGERERLWSLIEETPNLDWLLLTKRIGNVEKMLPERWRTELPRNVWLGITVVNQEEADRDIPKLLAIKAHVRFLSCEPLLGAIDLTHVAPKNGYASNVLAGYRHDFGVPITDLPAKVDWIIAGGESGPDARPLHPDWPRSLRDQCVAASVPFFFKQWGEWAPRGGAAFSDPARRGQLEPTTTVDSTDRKQIGQRGYVAYSWLDGSVERLQRIGKKRAGRELDGRTHDGFPEAA